MVERPLGDKPQKASRLRSAGFVTLTLALYLVAMELLVRTLYEPQPVAEFSPFVNPEWESREVYLKDPVYFWKFRQRL